MHDVTFREVNILIEIRIVKKIEYSSVCYVKVIPVPFDVSDIYLLLCKNVKEEIVEVFGMVTVIQH